MKKHQKQDTIVNLEAKFTASKAAFLVNYQGMTVAQLKTLRFRLDAKGGSLQVAKNRLVKIALQDISACHGLNDLLKGQLAYVFAQDEVTSVAKVLADFAKEHEQLKIVAGCSEARVYDARMVKALGSLPSREVLLAQLCGVLKAPMIQLALAVKAVAEQKSQAE